MLGKKCTLLGKPFLSKADTICKSSRRARDGFPPEIETSSLPNRVLDTNSFLAFSLTLFLTDCVCTLIQLPFILTLCYVRHVRCDIFFVTTFQTSFVTLSIFYVLLSFYFFDIKVERNLFKVDMTC